MGDAQNEILLSLYLSTISRPTLVISKQILTVPFIIYSNINLSSLFNLNLSSLFNLNRLAFFPRS
jgi:hypothetical protein